GQPGAFDAAQIRRTAAHQPHLGIAQREIDAPEIGNQHRQRRLGAEQREIENAGGGRAARGGGGGGGTTAGAGGCGSITWPCAAATAWAASTSMLVSLTVVLFLTTLRGSSGAGGLSRSGASVPVMGTSRGVTT